MLASGRAVDPPQSLLEFIDMSDTTDATPHNQPTDLLLSLAGIPGLSASSKERFKAKMAGANLLSIFDVVRLSKMEFAEVLNDIGEKESGQIYDQALSHVVQLEFLHREQRDLLSDEERAQRAAATASQHGATYTSLFPQDWNNVCTPESLAAIDSPAAYLRALYMFARELENTGKGQLPKTRLAQRRPSLMSMTVDAQAVNEQVPLLNLVNELLHGDIRKHLIDNKDVYRSDVVEEALAEQYYPLQLPFSLSHQQCLLGLGGDKPMLGELSYAISLTLPLSQQPSTVYGKVQQESYEAQRLLAALSPQQQSLITAEMANDDTPQGRNRLARTCLGSEFELLKSLPHFMAQTELDDEHMQALFCLGNFTPLLSPHVVTPLTAVPARVGIDIKDKDTAPVIDFVNVEQLDRLQRIIRLQRWTNIPYTEIKTFVHCVASAGAEVNTFTINDNTLRALGVYRYLSQRYTVSVEEFSAMVHHLSVHRVGQAPALHDRVYNSDRLFNDALTLDGSLFKLDARDDSDLIAVHKVCASLGVLNTPTSFGAMSQRIQQYLTPKKDLATFSSFYRQARLARLFGLSVLDMYQLAELLGGTDYIKQLVSPSLRASGSNAPADFLDVLMQMDWAVQWFSDAGTSLQTVRRQLLLDAVEAENGAHAYLQPFIEHLSALETYALPDESFPTLSQGEEEELKKLRFTKSHVLIKTILKTYPVLPETADLERLHKMLKKSVKSYLTPLNQDEDQDKVVERITSILSPYLTSAYTQLLPWNKQLVSTFSEHSTTIESSLIIDKRIKNAIQSMAVALGQKDSKKGLKHNVLVAPNASSLLALSVRSDALQTFVLHPHWLDSSNGAENFLKLSLNTLYLLQQFQSLLVHYRLNESDLLNYLKRVNDKSADNEAELIVHLSGLLGWSASEITALLKNTAYTRVQSITQLDWVARCHRACLRTGLSASVLLTVTNLNSHIPGPQWTQVGEAVMAVHA